MNAAIITDRLPLRSLTVQEANDEMQSFDKQAETWSKRLNHNYQRTEHLLLSMVTLPTCQAAQAIAMQGQSLREMGQEVLLVLGHTDIAWPD